MLILKRKALYWLIVLGVLFLSYDWLWHALAVALHMAFESFEWMLEELIEHIFQTTRKQSQIIVFYLLWFLGLMLCYRLARTLPLSYRWFRTQVNEFGERCGDVATCYWRKLSLIRKVKWLASFSLSFFVFAMLAFS